MKKLGTRYFLSEDTLHVAHDLIGKLLVVPDADGRRVSGMIVETEAYLGREDKGAHSYNGRRTTRNEVTYGEGGRVYVFFVYGMHHQLNFVTGPRDHPHVVLIRAVEPVEGIEVMRSRRGEMPDRNLTSGPGKLCAAFGIDRGLNGEVLTGERIWVEEFKKFTPAEIAADKRIGIDYAAEYKDRPWRFLLAASPFVSRKATALRR
jgi:DNA-3-methyladenine glycosylase